MVQKLSGNRFRKTIRGFPFPSGKYTLNIVHHDYRIAFGYMGAVSRWRCCFFHGYQSRNFYYKFVWVPNFTNWDDWKLIKNFIIFLTFAFLECEVAGCMPLHSATSVHDKRMQGKRTKFWCSPPTITLSQEYSIPKVGLILQVTKYLPVLWNY